MKKFSGKLSADNTCCTIKAGACVKNWKRDLFEIWFKSLLSQIVCVCVMDDPAALAPVGRAAGGEGTNMDQTWPSLSLWLYVSVCFREREGERVCHGQEKDRSYSFKSSYCLCVSTECYWIAARDLVPCLMKCLSRRVWHEKPSHLLMQQ